MSSFDDSFHFLQSLSIWRLQLTSLGCKSTKGSKSYSPIPSKNVVVEQANVDKCSQMDDDDEIALILQIEEIVLAENHINRKTDGWVSQIHQNWTGKKISFD